MNERTRRSSLLVTWAPMALLAAITLLDEFDAVASRVFINAIRQIYDLSRAEITLISSIQGIAVLLGAVPIAYLADRTRRTSMVWIATGIWGLAVSLVGSPIPVALFITARLATATSRAINTDVHASLLIDFYPGSKAPSAISIHRAASVIGALAAGPIVTWAERTYGLRSVFVAIAAPTAILVPLALRLREPTREGAASRLRVFPSIAETFLRLKAIRTMRWLWGGAFLMGAGLVPASALTFLFLDEIYAIGASGRGLFSTFTAAYAVIGYAGVGLYLRRDASARRLVAATIAGSFVFAIATMVMAISGARIGVVAGGIAAMGAAALISPLIALIAKLAPANIRTAAIAMLNVYTGLGGILLSQVVIRTAEMRGLRAGLFMVGVFIAAGATVASRGIWTVDEDLSQHADPRVTPWSRLSIQNLGVTRDNTLVLDDISFDIGEGEIVALCGPNGSGKSTLLRAISGIVGTPRGSIFLDGQEITMADLYRSSRLGCHLADPEDSLFPSLTVDEHLRLHRTEAAAFPELAELGTTRAQDLSGGERRLLALSLALSSPAKLLLLDEVFLGLSPEALEVAIGLMREASAQGRSVIFVDQAVKRAATIAERIVLLDRGRVTFDGSPREVPHGSPTFPATPANRSIPSDDPLLRVTGLRKSFSGVAVLDGFDLQVAAGERVGLRGPNGSGKTTLLQIVAGAIEPDAGEIYLEEHRIARLGPVARARLGIGVLHQDRLLWASLTVEECLMTAMETQGHRHGLSSMLRTVVRASERVKQLRAAEIIGMLRLNKLKGYPYQELSAGFQRRVQLGVAIAQQASLMLLDEPTAGVEEAAISDLAEIIEGIGDTTGAAMIIAEHHATFLKQVCHRVISMRAESVSPTKILPPTGPVESAQIAKS